MATTALVIDAARGGAPWIAAAAGSVGDDARLALVARHVSGVVHDVNTPLATVALRAEMLLTRLARSQAAGTPLDASVALQTIIEEARRCARLLATLQDFARPAQDGTKSFDLASLTAETLRLVEYTARRRRVRLLVAAATAAPLRLGEGSLRQAVLGVMSDAVARSASGATVEVCSASGPAGHVTLTLARSADDPAGGEESPGLRAARSAARALGGVIEEETGEGGGSVSLVLPLAPPAGPAEERMVGRG